MFPFSSLDEPVACLKPPERTAVRNAAMSASRSNVGTSTVPVTRGDEEWLQALIRIELFSDLGTDQILEIARRTHLYSRLLPGYGFPVGLADINNAEEPAPVKTDVAKPVAEPEKIGTFTRVKKEKR